MRIHYMHLENSGFSANIFSNEHSKTRVLNHAERSASPSVRPHEISRERVKRL
jgi:hypothetical protein